MSANTPEDANRDAASDPAQIARQVAEAMATRAQIPPFSQRGASLDLATAYRAAAALRSLRGGRLVGRKIGFTNRGIWERYGVASPMWGDVLAETCADIEAGESVVALSGFAEPRLEPEIALGLDRAPEPDMDLAQLGACIGWVAPAFEIVQSIYPAWRFDIADCVAAGALHGRLLIGRRVSARSLDLRQLPAVAVTLCKNQEPVDEGVGANALDGPVDALAHLVALLASDPLNPPIAAGEIISTGTLTDAWPLAPGERWSAHYRGVFSADIALRFD